MVAKKGITDTSVGVPVEHRVYRLHQLAPVGSIDAAGISLHKLEPVLECRFGEYLELARG